MAEDNENQTPPEDDQPEFSEESTSPEGESNVESSEVSAEDIVGDDADMTPEEAETLAAAMAAINQVEGGKAPKPAEPEMTDDEAATLAAAMSAINQVQGIADSAAPSAASQPQGQPFDSPVFSNEDSDSPKEGMDLLSDVHMDVRIELGRTKMYVEDVLKLGDGAVVELDKLAGDPVDIFVNNRKVAKGEVLVLNDMFCVRVSEIVDISTADV
jgi:flagellar motor switch protein FliN/FliY